jgi:hypothetical protein
MLAQETVTEGILYLKLTGHEGKRVSDGPTSRR